MDPRVFKAGVPRGVPKVRWQVHGDVDDPRKGLTCGAFADLRGGEGAFRADFRTNQFASTVAAVDFLPGFKADEYRKNLGPGCLPGVPQDTAARHLYLQPSKLAVSRQVQRPPGSNAEAYAKSLPTFEFNLADEDDRNWRADSSHSFDSYPFRKSIATESPCKTVHYDTSGAQTFLDPGSTSQPCKTAFESLVPKSPKTWVIAQDLDEFRQASLGPGCYGAPRLPRSDWNKDADRATPSPCFPSRFPRSKSRLSPDLLSPAKIKQYMVEEGPSGPGLYYTAAMAMATGGISPERSEPNESKRGSAAFLSPDRPSPLRRKDPGCPRKNGSPDPGAHFSSGRESKTWFRGADRSASRGSICAQVSRWDKVADRPRSESPSIKRQHLLQAFSESLSRSRRSVSRGDLESSCKTRRKSSEVDQNENESPSALQTRETVGFWPTDVLHSKLQNDPETHARLLEAKLLPKLRGDSSELSSIRQSYSREG